MICCVNPGSGIVLCLEKALEGAGVAREDVNYINAHAMSVPSDLEEYRAVVHCFGQNKEVSFLKWFAVLSCGCFFLNPSMFQLRMNSTKCMIGHLLGGAGAVEAVVTVKVTGVSSDHMHKLKCLFC